jgi:translation initiation factor IF-2
MSETTNTIRLMKAAKEFNVGKTTIVEFLTGKGFAVDNKPDPVLSGDMYDALIAEYDAERAAKKKSDKVVLAKAVADDKKNNVKPEKPVETVKITAPEVEGPKVLGKIDIDPKPAPKPDPVPEVKLEEKPVAKVEKTAEETSTSEEPKQPKAKKQADPERVKIEAPEIGGLKVMGKIDMDKPKAKKQVEEPKPPVVEKPVAEIIPETKENPSSETDLAKAEPEKIELHTLQRDKLAGPKIIGKIELPVDKDKKPVEKRKRKRIPVAGAEGQRPTGTGQQGTGNRDNNRPQGNGPRRDNRTGSGPHRNDDKVVDANEIQDKIKQTLAKLGNQSRGKGTKSKYRRSKREEMAEKRAMELGEDGEHKLQLTEFISVSELANLMNVSFSDVIGKCMGLGIMVSINQRLDAEVIELVASEFGYEVEFIDLEQEAEQEMDTLDDTDDLKPRPPIVTIMGHVDHGKTSLLDYIRSTNVVAGESGGITQHIGAYEVTLPNGKEITFLDTPGHEAFTAMRARGAKVTDISVIVVAADDAVMPQTREAISHAQAAGVPMIFAINKIDRDGANPERIREQLSAMNILVEEWGGKFQSQEISAKAGLNIDLLLEKILLESEILDLKANPDRFANGTVIEASLDKGRGFVSTILVQAGTLKIGDMVVAGSIYGRVKAMTDERGKKKKLAGPSTPVQILGLNGAPQSGEKFRVYDDEDEAKEIATHRAQILREQGMRTKKHITLDEIGRRLALGNFKQLNVIIKGDVDGSVEALSDSLQKLSTDEVAVSVVHKAVGQITESDVLLATASDAIILGFQVRPSSQAAKIAENENIEIRYYSIIYDAIDEIRSAMEGMLEPKIEKKAICNIEVREVFKITGVGAIAGCYVLEGKIKRDTKINLVRDGIVIYTGEMSSLKRFKDDVKEVMPGMECGIGIKNYNDLRNGDIIEGYEEIEIKRTL